MIRKNPYIEENYTLISKMTNMHAMSQKMLDETPSQRFEFDIEDSNTSMIEEGKSITGMKYMSQDLNSKRILESQMSIFEVTKKRLSQNANSMMAGSIAFNFSQDISSQKKLNLCNGCLADLNNEMMSTSVACVYCKKPLCEKCRIMCGQCQEVVCRICTQTRYEKDIDEIVCPNCFVNQ